MVHDDLHTLRLLLCIAFAVTLGFAALELADRPTAAGAAPGHAATTDALRPAGEPAPGALVAARPAVTAASPAEVAAPAAPVEPAATKVVQKRGGVACAAPHQLVRVTADTPIHARPNARTRPVGTLPARSIYLGQETTAWVQRVSRDGRWGLITLPWSKPVNRTGWVPLTGRRSSTRTMVVADLSERRLTVYRGCTPQFSVRTAIGRPGSPSPKGRYWVTDRISVPTAQRASFGSYAFGLSTVQPNLPAGWTGGDQMAIHGTGAPGSIGEAASAGCLRVDEQALARLKPLLRNGTPVIITA